MRAYGMCSTGSGHLREDPELLKGVLATDTEVPEDAERLVIHEERCAACTARGVRCFHDQLPRRTRGQNEENEA